VNVPGYFYSADASGNPSSTICPVDTYGPGLRKQRACVPCPPGYTTRGQTGSTSTRACVVPEGYYLKGPGQVAPCPKGEYKAGFEALPSCTKCAAGVSTKTEASTSEAACTEVLPTFYPETITDNIVKSTQKCPQKYYCPGGSPKAIFDPVNAPTVTADTTVQQCADGTWTENIGASSADQCMTPPGYKTSVGAGPSGTTPCADGEYRADWKPASAAGSCQVCGDNILSSATEQITSYSIDKNATPSPIYVRATAAACYIKPGQGMYFSAASSSYRAVNCETNQYGVANTTYGLAAFPCRDCPAGMQTSTSLTSSNAYYVSDGAGKQGFTSPMACVTKAGYGYNGRVATKCPAGSYNAAGNYGTCTKCAVGLSTQDNADSQVSSANCTLAIGYGFHDNAIVPCPVGTYNDVLRADTTSPCGSCPAGLSTSQAGGRSLTDCNVCSAGYGGANCATQCGAGNGATFGPAGRPEGTACEACPAMTTGFSFDYLAVNQNFTPAAVARAGADSPADCLAEFAQIADAAWFLGGSVAMTNVTQASGVTTFDGCVADCKADGNCQYITFDYDAATCWKKAVTAPATTGDVVAFKAVTAGDTTAAGTRKKVAKGLSSGSYTFWKDSAANVGASSSAGPTDSIQACLSACDNDFDCAAVTMTGVTSDASLPTSCNLIKGDKTIATFRRSVTKAVASQLKVADAK